MPKGLFCDYQGWHAGVHGGGAVNTAPGCRTWCFLDGLGKDVPMRFYAPTITQGVNQPTH